MRNRGVDTSKINVGMYSILGSNIRLSKLFIRLQFALRNFYQVTFK